MGNNTSNVWKVNKLDHVCVCPTTVQVRAWSVSVWEKEYYTHGGDAREPKPQSASPPTLGDIATLKKLGLRLPGKRYQRIET